MGLNACDVVYDTSEEASTWRQAKAAERNTRARARRGAGDQSRRYATVGRLQPTDRRAFCDGCRAGGSPPPSLSSLKAASGSLLSQLSQHFRPAAKSSLSTEVQGKAAAARVCDGSRLRL